MKITKEQQARRVEVAKVKSALTDAIPVNVEITSILLALADMTREFTSLLIRKFEEAEIPLRDTHECTKCGRRLRRFIVNGKSRYMTDDGKRHYRYCNMPPNTARTGLAPTAQSEGEGSTGASQ